MTSPGHHLHPPSHWHSARRGGYDSRSDEYDSDSDGSYASGDDRRRSDIGHYRVPRSHSLGRRRYLGNAYRDVDSDHEQSDSASYTGHERYDNYSDDGY
ncbi:hypothetical protein AMATHDRAFT_59422 [Amanita thiersii Skay4041]|uniref:Uncharacterized protein n=1 Tax=Amanita thiersii Skay4041 TaxID=703135 RepID=A0A2A9NK37_9AGAR|nr:hypothetical protein AMATHDRAFT_59422 [Amanita thiersii Skay4041]